MSATLTAGPAGGPGHGPAPAPPVPSVGQHWPLLLALVLSSAVVTVDNTVLNVALPAISEHLHTGTDQLQWIVNAYSLVFGGLLLTGGSIADRLGRRRVLLGGLVTFGLASSLVVFVGSAGQLIGLRALVGAAAAFVMPSTLAILVRAFDGPARAAAVGIWGAVAAAGFAVGPVLGGLVLAHFSWQGVFLINVPIAALAVVATLAWVPASAERTAGRADLLGTVLSVATMLALVDGLISGPVDGWLSARVLGGFGAFLLAGAAFVGWELRAPHPMVDVRALARRTFAGPALAEGALMLATAGSMFLLTQHLQLVDGYSPLQAGLLVAPAALGVVVASPVVAKLSGRINAPRSAALGLGLGAVALVEMGIVLRQGYWPLGVGLFVFGIGLRFAMTPVALAVMDALPKERAGMGSALNDTFQEIGGALGVALLGSVFSWVYRDALPAGAPAAARSSLAGALGTGDGRVAAAARQAFDSGMQAAVWVCAGVLVVTAVTALRTIPRDARVDEAA